MGLATWNLNRARAAEEAAQARRERQQREREAQKKREAAPAPKASVETCKHGHALTDDNLTVRKDGARLCRTCMREAGARRHQKQSGGGS